MIKYINKENSVNIGNILIPGDGDLWIKFEYAMGEGSTIEIYISDAEEVPFDRYQDRISMPGADLVMETAAFEALEPALFAKIYRAFLDVYYSAAVVMAQVTRLANQAPKEDDAVFDRALLASVLANGTGKRRL